MLGRVVGSGNPGGGELGAGLFGGPVTGRRAMTVELAELALAGAAVAIPRFAVA